jgi:hypothetical protein
MLPDNWGAQVTLQLQVDESSALNPGVAFNTPMHSAITHFVGEGVGGSTSVMQGRAFPFLSTPQSYSLGLGGALSSAATRIDKFNAFWSVPTLVQPKVKGGLCDPSVKTSLLRKIQASFQARLPSLFRATWVSKSGL